MHSAMDASFLFWSIGLFIYNLLAPSLLLSRVFLTGGIAMSNVPLWAYLTTALLGGGALVTIVVKIIEIKAATRQKRTDNFLQNSQPHVDTLYKPIDKSLSQLEDSYRRYKKGKAFLTSARLGKVTISPS